ncbi:hypothetical protein C8Q76DRAFT_738973 [Earliella scabrosa]|nr:hypothetical protein C8Q76DRAFT_738973 [Earliella scabrosa]
MPCSRLAPCILYALFLRPYQYVSSFAKLKTRFCDDQFLCQQVYTSPNLQPNSGLAMVMCPFSFSFLLGNLSSRATASSSSTTTRQGAATTSLNWRSAQVRSSLYPARTVIVINQRAPIATPLENRLR